MTRRIDESFSRKKSWSNIFWTNKQQGCYTVTVLQHQTFWPKRKLLKVKRIPRNSLAKSHRALPTVAMFGICDMSQCYDGSSNKPLESRQCVPIPETMPQKRTVLNIPSSHTDIFGAFYGCSKNSVLEHTFSYSGSSKVHSYKTQP